MAQATYTTIQGDMWDRISYAVYGTEKQMHTLIAANPDYREVVIFSAGVTVTCPEVDSSVNEALPPWLQ